MVEWETHGRVPGTYGGNDLNCRYTSVDTHLYALQPTLGWSGHRKALVP